MDIYSIVYVCIECTYAVCDYMLNIYMHTDLECTYSCGCIHMHYILSYMHTHLIYIYTLLYRSYPTAVISLKWLSSTPAPLPQACCRSMYRCNIYIQQLYTQQHYTLVVYIGVVYAMVAYTVIVYTVVVVVIMIKSIN